MNSTYDPITREHVVAVIVRDIRFLGSTAYGSGACADGRLVSFIIDRKLAHDLALRLDRGESVEVAIPSWAIFSGGPSPATLTQADTAADGR